MEIETLQIKRVTNNWENHKSYSPKDGEYVLIEAGVIKENSPKTLVLGTSSKETLENLINKSDCIIPFKSDNTNTIESKINELKPTSDTTNISATSNDKGTSTQFAYSDHTHKLEKNIAEAALNTNTDITSSFNCRRIKAGTQLPNINDCNIGDIFILYE